MPEKNAYAMPSAREIAALTVPQLGMMLCHLSISMTDLWVAGRLGADVQASIGIVSQVFTLLMLVASLAGSGCLAAISQSLGAGLGRRARRYAALIVGMAGMTGLAAAALGLLSLPLTLRFMHVPPPLEPVVRTFIIAYSCQLPFYYTLIMFNSVFRAYKLVSLPLIAVAAVASIITLAVFAARACRVGRSSFYVIAACAASSLLVFQTCLNVFGSVDILPLTGVTFPFVSNGGSAMMSAWGLLAFLKATDTREHASFAIRDLSWHRPARRQVRKEGAYEED